jgi:hypothetical protein
MICERSYDPATLFDLNPVHRAVSDLCGRGFQELFDVLWTIPLGTGFGLHAQPVFPATLRMYIAAYTLNCQCGHIHGFSGSD